MSETISLGQIKAEIRADIQDFMRKMAAVEKKLGDVGKGAKSTEKQAASLGQGFGGLTASVAGAVAAFFSVGAAMKAFDMGRIGAQLKDASIVFKAAGNDIEEFRAKTRNLISDQVLVQKFNFASQMGISKDTFLQLANIADAAAKKMGISQEYAFSSLITGTARGSKLILDNVGILYSAEKAYEDYARSIGKTAKELTDFDQKMATQAAVLKAGNQMIKDVQGVGATVSDVYDQWDATMGNLTTTIGQFFDTIAQKYGIISDLIKAGRDATDVFNQLAKSIKEGGVGKAIEDAWGHETGQAIKNYAAAFTSNLFGGEGTILGTWVGEKLGGGAQDDALWGQQEKAVELTEHLKDVKREFDQVWQDAKIGKINIKEAEASLAELRKEISKTEEALTESRILTGASRGRGAWMDSLRMGTPEGFAGITGNREKEMEWYRGWQKLQGELESKRAEKEADEKAKRDKEAEQEAKQHAKEIARLWEDNAARIQEMQEEAIQREWDLRQAMWDNIADLAKNAGPDLVELANKIGDGSITSELIKGSALEQEAKAEAVKRGGGLGGALRDQAQAAQAAQAAREQAAQQKDLDRGSALYGAAFLDPASIGYAIGDKVFGGGSAQSFGAAMGGPLGAAVAPMIADAIGAVLEPLFDAVLNALAVDSRLQGAGGDALGMVGGAATGVGGAAAAGLVALTVALGGTITAATGGAALLVGAIVAFGAALYMLPPAMFMFMTSLGQGETTAQQLADAEEQTATTFERYQGAQALVIDRLVAAAQPFYDSLLWFVGLLDVAVGPLVALTESMATSEVLHRALFEAVRMVTVGLLYLVGAASVVFEAFEFVAGAVMFLGDFVSLMASNGGNWEAALEEAGDRLADSGALSWDGPTPSEINDAIQAVMSLSYDEATARGELIAGMYDEMTQRKKLNDELYNAPIGFKVAAFRFGAADAATPGVGTGIPGNATPVGGNGGRVIQITGDVNFIIENASEPEDVAGAVADRLEMDERFQTGSSRRIRHPWE